MFPTYLLFIAHFRGIDKLVATQLPIAKPKTTSFYAYIKPNIF